MDFAFGLERLRTFLCVGWLVYNEMVSASDGKYFVWTKMERRDFTQTFRGLVLTPPSLQ